MERAIREQEIEGNGKKRKNVGGAQLAFFP